MADNKQIICELIDEINIYSSMLNQYNNRVKEHGESPISNHMKQAFGELKHYVSKLDEFMPKH
ncbi:MAG: hypothetical protein QE487_06740 [Fluviicola sp.]|nr:hypothetical protein [Fluviicola sp.]